MADTLLGSARIRIRPDTTGFQGEADSAIKRTLGGLASTIAKGLALTGAAVGAAGAIGVKTASQLEQATIGFSTMLGSAQAADAFLRKLSAFAASTPFEFPELQQAASKLVAVGVNADRVIPLMTVLGDSTAAMGTGAAGIDRAVTALQQMRVKGKVTGEEMLQLAEAGVPAWEALAKQLGVSTGAAQEMVTAGKVSVDQLYTAIETRQGETLNRTKGMMAEQSKSLAGMWSTAKDTIQLNLAEAVKPFIPAMKQAMDAALPLMDTVLGKISDFAPTFLTALGGVKDFITGNDFTGAFVSLGIPVSVVQTLEDFRTNFVNIFNNVKAIIQDVGPTIGLVLGSGVKLAWEAVKLLLPAIESVTGFLKDNELVLWTLVGAYTALNVVTKAHAATMAVEAAGGLMKYLKATQLVSGAMKVGTAIQWAFNAAMSANPLVLVGILLAALVAGIVLAYKHSETFRNIVQGAFKAVGDAATWLWTSVLQPVFSAIGTAFKAVADAISWAWTTLIQPVWNVIAEVAKVLGMILIVAVFGPIVVAWKLLAAAIEFAWVHIIQPVWNAISTAAQWLYSNVLQPVFAAIGSAWQFLVAAMSFYWEHLLKPVFNAIATAAGWLWDTVLSPVFSAIGTAWGALADGMSWVWQTVLAPVFDWFGRVLGTLKDGFVTAVDFIGKAWQGLKEALMAPVQFVVDAIWNDGLRSLWNTISSLWGGKPIDPFILNAPVQVRGGAMKALASGGVLPGYSPGRDIHEFYSPTGGRLNLSGGEAVMRPEFTKALGSTGIAELNRIARTSGAQGVREALAGNQSFASGGIISLPGWISPILSAIPGGGAVQSIIDRVNGADGFGGGRWGEALIGMAKSIGSKIWEKAQSLFGSSSKPLPGLGGAEQWRGIVTQVVSMLGLNPSAINGVLAMIQHESGGNPNARNDWDSNAMAGHPSVGLLQTIPSTFAAHAGPFISRGILDPLANIYAGVHYALARYGPQMLEAGGRHTASGGYLGYATGGVLPGVFDTGGVLKSGGLALNKSGKPERVLSPSQSDALEAFLRDGGSRSGAALVIEGGFHIHPSDPGEGVHSQMEEAVFQLRKVARGGVHR